MSDEWVGSLAARVLPDGRALVVYPLTFGRARLTISESVDSWGYDDAW